MTRIVGVHTRATQHSERHWNGWHSVKTVLVRQLHATKGWRVIRHKRTVEPIAKRGRRGKMIYETYELVK